MGRFARNMLARASGGSLTLTRLWPGRADRLIIAPHDLRTADATRAAEIYAGRFVFAGKIVTCHGRSIFDLEPPSEDWEVALLGFGWLRHLRAADTALTRANARALVDDWISNPSQKRPIARRADVLARRVISLLSQAPLVLGDTDSKFYRRYLRALTREIRYMRFALLDMPDGVPRLQVLIAQCYASLCLANQARHIRSASRKLSDELQQQILPDGGHISRNPGALIELLIDLLPLRQTFAARNIAPPPALLNAIDRMMPMLRFFRHGDGTIALFNGMSGTPSDLLATLLAYDDTHGTPMASMPHTGFQRLDAGQMTVIIDTGAPPPPNVRLCMLPARDRRGDRPGCERGPAGDAWPPGHADLQVRHRTPPESTPPGRGAGVRLEQRDAQQRADDPAGNDRRQLASVPSRHGPGC